MEASIKMNVIDIITTFSGLVATLAFFWAFFFGSKTIFDVIKKKRKGNKPTTRGRKPTTNPLLIINIFWLVVVFLLSSTFLITLNILSSSASRASSILSSPGGLGLSQTDLVLTSPPVPTVVDCSLNCVSKLDVVLEHVVFEHDQNNVLVTFNLTNKENSVCSMGVNELNLEDAQGNKYSGLGQIRSVRSLNPGQELEASAYFSFKPSPDAPYLLSLVLSCQATLPMVYQDENISFSHPEGLSFALAPSPPYNPIFILTITGAILGVLIFLIFLIDWLITPSPFGILQQGQHSAPLRDIHTDSLSRWLFGKSKVSSDELEAVGFDLLGTHFDLVFKRGRRAYIEKKPTRSSIEIEHKESGITEIVSKSRTRLLNGDIIRIDGKNDTRFFEHSGTLLPEGTLLQDEEIQNHKITIDNERQS